MEDNLELEADVQGRFIGSTPLSTPLFLDFQCILILTVPFSVSFGYE